MMTATMWCTEVLSQFIICIVISTIFSPLAARGSCIWEDSADPKGLFSQGKPNQRPILTKLVAMAAKDCLPAVGLDAWLGLLFVPCTSRCFKRVKAVWMMTAVMMVKACQ